MDTTKRHFALFVLALFAAVSPAFANESPNDETPASGLSDRDTTLPPTKRTKLKAVISAGNDREGASAHICLLPDGKRALVATCPGFSDVERYLGTDSGSDESMPQ